jgi:hypothetical protein
MVYAWASGLYTFKIGESFIYPVIFLSGTILFSYFLLLLNIIYLILISLTHAKYKKYTSIWNL